MAQNSWPFVGGGGTAVNEDQWSIMSRYWAQSGVTDYANLLEVYGDSSGRQVKVKTGRACVRGHWYENTAEETVAIAANASGNPRIDRIVLRLDPSANSIVLAVVQGTPAGSPSAPALTQTDVGTYELTLARVAVANGASTIAVGDVTDERALISASYPADRITSGVWSATTNASGYVTITLPESPTGSWAVIVMEANASLRLVSLIGATSTSAVVRVMYTNGTDLLILASSSVTLHYIAVAY